MRSPLTSRNFAIEDNSIEELPEDIGDMESLRTLDARNNKLKTVPGSFSLKNLTCYRPSALRAFHLEFSCLGTQRLHSRHVPHKDRCKKAAGTHKKRALEMRARVNETPLNVADL